MLNEKQKKCLKLLTSGEFKQKEIANQINITEKTICEWKKDPEFMSELERCLNISIKSLAAKALHTQSKLLDAKSETVRYMVTKDILDRAGFKPNDKIKIEGSVPVVISGGDELED